MNESTTVNLWLCVTQISKYCSAAAHTEETRCISNSLAQCSSQYPNYNASLFSYADKVNTV